MHYKDFVKEMFQKHKGKMPAKEIMKMAAQEWPSVRDGKKMTTKKGKKEEKAGSLLGEILGYGLNDKKDKGMVGGGPVGGRMTNKKKGKGQQAGSLLGEILGFGLDDSKATKKMSNKQGMIQPDEGGKLKKSKQLPKKTNPLSQFYQFNELPESNMQGSGLVGGLYPVDKKEKEEGAGFFDNIMPLWPLALL